jgi:hypothetical protein
VNPLALLGRVPFRFYIYAAVAAFIAFLMWKEDRQTKKLNARNADIAHLESQVGLLQSALANAHENVRKANEASQKFQTELSDLETRQRAEPIGAVRLCSRIENLPAAPAASTSAAGSDAASAERVAGPPEEDSRLWSAGRDIGPDLDDYGRDCEAVGIQLGILQEWVRSR